MLRALLLFRRIHTQASRAIHYQKKKIIIIILPSCFRDVRVLLPQRIPEAKQQHAALLVRVVRLALILRTHHVSHNVLTFSYVLLDLRTHSQTVVDSMVKKTRALDDE